MTKKCGNCSFACHINVNHGANLEVVFCSYWVETEHIKHSCIKFQPLDKSKFYYHQDFKSRKILRYAKQPI